MLLSLRFILRHTVLKYIIVVVCAPEQPTTWSLPIVLHITLGILEQFWWSKWPPKALKKTFSNNTKNVSKQSVFTKLSADQSVITKSPDTKLPISQEPLNIIICFNDYHEALFNTLLSAINRSIGNKIPWRYKVLNVCTWY